MTLDAERLRSEFQSAEGTAPGETCPAPELFWQLVRGEPPARQLGSLVRHTLRCSACGSALRLARDLETNVEGPVVVSPRPLGRTRLWLGLAAGLGVASALAVLVRAPAPSGRTGMVLERGPAAGAMRSLVPAGPRPRTGLVLAWTPFPGALRYVVTLASPKLEVLYKQAGVRETELRVPPDVLAKLPSGARLVWKVEAVLGDGEVQESPAFDLVLE